MVCNLAHIFLIGSFLRFVGMVIFYFRGLNSYGGEKERHQNRWRAAHRASKARKDNIVYGNNSSLLGVTF